MPGLSAAEAGAQLDPDLPAALRAGTAYLTDARGIRLTGAEPVSAGTILRIVRRNAETPGRREAEMSGRRDAETPRRRDAETSLTRELIARLPKAELHVHLDGSLRPGTMLELAREYRVALPADDPESLYRYMVVTDARNLEDYLKRFDVTVALLQRAEGFHPVVAALQNGRSAAIDGAWGSSASLAAAGLALHVPRTLLVVIAHPRDLDGWAEDLHNFAGIRPVIFPAWDNLPSAEQGFDETSGQRLRLLQQFGKDKAPRLVLATFQALMQPVPERAQIAANQRIVKAGASVDPDDQGMRKTLGNPSAGKGSRRCIPWASRG